MLELRERLSDSFRAEWEGRKWLNDLYFSFFSSPWDAICPGFLVVQSKSESTARACYSKQFALNLCVSDELLPPFHSRLSSVFPCIYSFLNFTSLWVLFPALFLLHSLKMAWHVLKKRKRTLPWHQFKKKERVLVSKGRATFKTAGHVSGCRYISCRVLERFWPSAHRAFLHPCTSSQ